MNIYRICRWIMEYRKAKANNYCEWRMHDIQSWNRWRGMPVNMISNIVAIDINFGQDKNSIWSSPLNGECMNIESTWLYLIR